MTSLLSKAFEKASKLSATAQDELARQLLADIESEQKWQTAFDGSDKKVERLANEALREYEAGKTKEMGFDEL